MRGIFDETNPADMVEYHVVRDGVDEEEILSFARGTFTEASLIQYWSSQLGVAQRLGERLGMHNAFGIVAHGYNSKLSSSTSKFLLTQGPKYRRGNPHLSVITVFRLMPSRGATMCCCGPRCG
jgi:hypothetical protein